MNARALCIGFLAAACALADDTSALQGRINRCAPNGTIRLEPRDYFVRPLWLKSDCTYMGFPGKTVLRLAAPNQFIVEVSEKKNIHISGIAFDGNNMGGAIVARGNGPSSGISIDTCSFTGVPANVPFPMNLAVFSSWALIDSTFRDNTFHDVAGGIWMTTIENVAIENNSFTHVTQGNAIYIAPNPVPFPSGHNLRVAGNKGSGLARMGIEIFRPHPTNGSSLYAPVIENNEFSGWISPKDGFGLSITHGDGAIVRNNSIRNSGKATQYLGIEVIVDNAVVQGNTIDGGFAYGIAVQGTAGSKVLDNKISNMADTGIILACDGGRHRCASRDSLISGNTIVNARRVGISLDNDWSNSKIVHNTILRTGGFWPDDSAVYFAGIHQSPAAGPGVIDFNTIVQNAPAPPAGFGFCGFRINSPMPGSSIADNVVRSESRMPLGVGILDNTGSATAKWLIERDRFVNLTSART
jgi:parallel beta-helix repeat protein